MGPARWFFVGVSHVVVVRWWLRLVTSQRPVTSQRLSPSRRVADGNCGWALAVAASWSRAPPRGLSFLLTWRFALGVFQEQNQKLYSRSLRSHTHGAEEDTKVCSNSSGEARSRRNNSMPAG